MTINREKVKNLSFSELKAVLDFLQDEWNKAGDGAPRIDAANKMILIQSEISNRVNALFNP